MSPATVELVKALKEGMATLPVEHFLALGLDRDGNVCFEEWQSNGEWDHCNVDYDRILARAKESASVTVFCAHNHPDGSDYPSNGDKTLTTQLERKLAAAKITLLDHAIVPGDVMRIQESRRPMVTTWDLREMEHQRLWAPYLHDGSRQTEASAYPRDAFDEEQLVSLLTQEAMNILHAVDIPTRRRVLRAVMQRLEGQG
jgi:hypothetical protein